MKYEVKLDCVALGTTQGWPKIGVDGSEPAPPVASQHLGMSVSIGPEWCNLVSSTTASPAIIRAAGPGCPHGMEHLLQKDQVERLREIAQHGIARNNPTEI